MRDGSPRCVALEFNVSEPGRARYRASRMASPSRGFAGAGARSWCWIRPSPGRRSLARAPPSPPKAGTTSQRSSKMRRSPTGEAGGVASSSGSRGNAGSAPTTARRALTSTADTDRDMLRRRDQPALWVRQRGREVAAGVEDLGVGGAQHGLAHLLADGMEPMAHDGNRDRIDRFAHFLALASPIPRRSGRGEPRAGGETAASSGAPAFGW